MLYNSLCFTNFKTDLEKLLCNNNRVTNTTELEPAIVSNTTELEPAIHGSHSDDVTTPQYLTKKSRKENERKKMQELQL